MRYKANISLQFSAQLLHTESWPRPDTESCTNSQTWLNLGKPNFLSACTAGSQLSQESYFECAYFSRQDRLLDPTSPRILPEDTTFSLSKSQGQLETRIQAAEAEQAVSW